MREAIRDALRRTQMHSDALRCTQMHSETSRRPSSSNRARIELESSSNRARIECCITHLGAEQPGGLAPSPEHTEARAPPKRGEPHDPLELEQPGGASPGCLNGRGFETARAATADQRGSKGAVGGGEGGGAPSLSAVLSAHGTRARERRAERLTFGHRLQRERRAEHVARRRRQRRACRRRRTRRRRERGRGGGRLVALVPALVPALITALQCRVEGVNGPSEREIRLRPTGRVVDPATERLARHA